MSNIEDDLNEIIREKIKTAEQVNNSFKRSAGRALKLKKSGEPMAAYRKNKKAIDAAKAKYQTPTSNDNAVNE